MSAQNPGSQVKPFAGDQDQQDSTAEVSLRMMEDELENED